MDIEVTTDRMAIEFMQDIAKLRATEVVVGWDSNDLHWDDNTMIPTASIVEDHQERWLQFEPLLDSNQDKIISSYIDWMRNKRAVRRVGGIIVGLLAERIKTVRFPELPHDTVDFKRAKKHGAWKYFTFTKYTHLYAPEKPMIDSGVMLDQLSVKSYSEAS